MASYRLFVCVVVCIISNPVFESQGQDIELHQAYIWSYIHSNKFFNKFICIIFILKCSTTGPQTVFRWKWQKSNGKDWEALFRFEKLPPWNYLRFSSSFLAIFSKFQCKKFWMDDLFFQRQYYQFSNLINYQFEASRDFPRRYLFKRLGNFLFITQKP